MANFSKAHVYIYSFMNDETMLLRAKVNHILIGQVVANLFSPFEYQFDVIENQLICVYLYNDSVYSKIIVKLSGYVLPSRILRSICLLAFAGYILPNLCW
jgi:hypothetical protein